MSLSEAFQYDDAVHLVLESGILDITSSQANFIDKCSFIGNIGSAIYAESAQIESSTLVLKLCLKQIMPVNWVVLCMLPLLTRQCLFSPTDVSFPSTLWISL